MLLDKRTAVIYGGGGAIGGAAARAFAREGATVHLVGRTQANLDAVADHVITAGGTAHTAIVDVLDQDAVEAHAAQVADAAGGIDIALNAVGFLHVQGTPLAELSLEDYLHPIETYARANFITAKATSRHMVKQGAGVILTLSTPGTRMAVPGSLGYSATCGAVEAFSRVLAGELGPSGIRVVCLRPDVIPEGLATSHVGEVFAGIAERHGTTVDAMVADRAGSGTLLGRFPTLAQVGDAAALAASDRAGAMTGTIVNLTCGSVVD